MEAQPLRAADPDADSLSKYVQMKYGLDQGLVSGFQYYARFPQYKGDPFFPEDAFLEGSVSMKGLQYENLHLKYNCFTQGLILEYTDFQDGYNLLRLNNACIDSFRLGKHHFQKLSLGYEEPKFYQVLSSGQVTCYIHWEKGIQSIHNSVQYTYEYTKPQRSYYFNIGDRTHLYVNRKSFLDIFAEAIQAEIKKYIKHQHFSFRNASPEEIQGLLVFINKQTEKNG